LFKINVNDQDPKIFKDALKYGYSYQ
jgi:hypothetical protein